MSRSQSPSWDTMTSNSVALLPLGSGSGGGNWKSNGHTLLSRTPSPYPPSRVNGEEDTVQNSGSRGLRVGSGNALGSWFKKGKLGWWLWNTQRGWISLVSALVIFNIGSGLFLVLQNQFIMRTGVYKFGFPITTTLLELLVIEFLLMLTASLSRSFSSTLHSLGLSHIIAPGPTPLKNKKGPSKWSVPMFEDWTSSGIFGFDFRLAQIVLPVATIYTAMLILSNFSFAYALRQIYQLSRIANLPLTVLFTYFWANQNPPLSVTTLSSTLTLTFATVMVSIHPPYLFTWEGVVGGICSSFFAAGYPIALLNTYKKVLGNHPSHDRPEHEEEILIDPSNTVYFQGDGKSVSRAHWRLLHYTNMLSIILTLPWVFMSGEAGNMSRNCYILDIPWFWFMIFLGGLASWGTFVGGWILVKTTSPLTGNAVNGLQVTIQSVMLSGFKLPEWGWTGAITGWAAGVWYMLGRRREVGVSLWGSGDERELLWDGDGVQEDGGRTGNNEPGEDEWLVS
ncbi:hypothetical protein BDZ91DRAFT_658655 [Kalaharituber pfeilii]|nr:hypothetical protein BDZ91DRAFT_658655 [Kalaharituber pfeilii]